MVKEKIASTQQWIKYTLDGEVFVDGRSGQVIEHQLRTVDLFEPLPFRVKIPHTQYMRDLYESIVNVQKLQPGRLMPLTQREAPGFFRRPHKEPLKELLEAQLVRMNSILVNLPDGKERQEDVIYFTPQGRAFVRKFIAPDYAITANL